MITPQLLFELQKCDKDENYKKKCRPKSVDKGMEFVDASSTKINPFEDQEGDVYLHL